MTDIIKQATKRLVEQGISDYQKKKVSKKSKKNSNLDEYKEHKKDFLSRAKRIYHIENPKDAWKKFIEWCEERPYCSFKNYGKLDPAHPQGISNNIDDFFVHYKRQHALEEAKTATQYDIVKELIGKNASTDNTNKFYGFDIKDEIDKLSKDDLKRIENYMKTHNYRDEGRRKREKFYIDVRLKNCDDRSNYGMNVVYEYAKGVLTLSKTTKQVYKYINNCINYFQLLKKYKKQLFLSPNDDTKKLNNIASHAIYNHFDIPTYKGFKRCSDKVQQIIDLFEDVLDNKYNYSKTVYSNIDVDGIKQIVKDLKKMVRSKRKNTDKDDTPQPQPKKKVKVYKKTKSKTKKTDIECYKGRSDINYYFDVDNYKSLRNKTETINKYLLELSTLLKYNYDDCKDKKAYKNAVKYRNMIYGSDDTIRKLWKAIWKKLNHQNFNQ